MPNFSVFYFFYFFIYLYLLLFLITFIYFTFIFIFLFLLDLRQDMLILQVIQIVDFIWQEEGLDLR